DREVDSLFSPVANYLERDGSLLLARKRAGQRSDAVYLLIVDGDDYIAGFKASFGCGAIVSNRSDKHAFGVFHSEEFGKLTGERLSADSKTRAAEVRELAGIHESIFTEVWKRLEPLLRFFPSLVGLLERFFSALHRFLVALPYRLIEVRSKQVVALEGALRQSSS